MQDEADEADRGPVLAVKLEWESLQEADWTLDLDYLSVWKQFFLGAGAESSIGSCNLMHTFASIAVSTLKDHKVG